MGIDNLGCVRAAHRLTGSSYEETKPRKPWGLIPDGDVLHIMHEVSHAKGVNSINTFKVKAHATTTKGVIDGKITSWERKANNGIDLFAKPTPYWSSRLSTR